MTNRRMLLYGAATAALMVASAVSAQANGYGSSVADTFEGFYIGGHVGYGQSTYKGADSAGPDFLKTTPSGFLVGMHAGYNWQLSSRWLVGLEADVTATPGWKGNQTTCNSCSSGIWGELGGLATIRGRLGLTFDRSLIYATGGIAFASSNAIGVSSDPDTFSRDAQIVTGGVVGGGFEWKYRPDLSLRLEGLYYMFNEDRQTGQGTSGHAGIRNAGVVRVGASWYY